MPLYENPLFRETVVPWYDSTLACIVTMAVMAGGFIFGVIGYLTALETPESHRYAWVPVLLAGMSLAVILSIAVRLFLRCARRRKQRRERRSSTSTLADRL
ncbi:hypothetical protein [Desulfococcus multivorans]|uniref:Uncharacterized protein n=1 Tax=Desulfococcus multivorans DSM 2059 TaxID=1121405 RepID=S7UPT6_DESML|nr:hypothetical protein [Desulfococcus multivorans]AOY60066.1 conserved uncharacterized protein [Desulfococcus multivorans]AQV02204.1 hypothetical protein B2D07_16490 [Desulfococcus multivorans]EPR36059.1 hypothetical protein dsmv_0764 [Desulfococcus multivorans DSM 2059]SJZ37751.1 hypothetical protein SAMN02745446_00284 [Desulfococcus multivorans DSM 2059]